MSKFMLLSSGFLLHLSIEYKRCNLRDWHERGCVLEGGHFLHVVLDAARLITIHLLRSRPGSARGVSISSQPAFYG